MTFVLFGSLYYILPRMVGHEWPSARLIRWHFWSVLIGIALYVIPLTVFGVMQGLALADPQVPFQESVDISLPGLILRSIAGVILTFGHLVFAWHVWRMVRGPAPERTTPPFHDVVPVVYPATKREVTP